MKKFMFFLAIAAFSTFSFAQSGTNPSANPAPATAAGASERPLPEVLQWMVGQWEGEGVAHDQHFVARMNVTSELDGTVLMVTRESSSKDSTLAGGLKEIMLVGLDGTTKKVVATLYDNKNRIALYVGESKQNEIDFSLATAPQGYVDRRIFRQLPDGGLNFVIEGATPGKEVSKGVEINFKKKS